jgi:hypothetical protein
MTMINNRYLIIISEFVSKVLRADREKYNKESTKNKNQTEKIREGICINKLIKQY